MKILITGAKGFVGKNLVCNLRNIMEGKNRTRPGIRLSGAGATGALIHENDITWQDIIKTASIQNVLPLVSCALLNNPELSCPELIKERLLDLMRSASAANAIRRQRTCKITVVMP